MPGEQYSRADLSGLLQAVQRLCAARDLETVVDVVRTTARALVDADGATFVLREGDQVFYAAEDAISPLWQGRRFAASACISGWVMLNRCSAVIQDIYADERIPCDAYRPTFVKSLAMVPVNREQPIAAIGAYWAQHHVASPRELELLQALADAAATAVANSDLYRGLVHVRSELERASTHLRLALEAGAIGTWDYDPQSGALEWDEKSAELFGVPAHITLDYDFFLRCVHPDDRDAVNAAVTAATESAHGHYDMEYRTAQHGGQRWLAARGRVQFDESHRARRFVGTLRDISAQKQVESERSLLLQRANDANLAKDEFLAMLGHELRNPLAPIVTAVELLKRRGHGELREVETIERQSQHLTRLVDDLLDIERVTRGKLELKRRRCELQAIVAKAIELAAPLIERRAQVLTVDLEPGIALEGDELRLAQLFANLLMNAAKYTDEAGHIRVVARTFASRHEVEISVSDTGCGIPAELLPRLFAPFVQARQSSARSLGGLGLGLALARSLAELHGGSIRVHSAGAGQGSEFTVRLPLPVASQAVADASERALTNSAPAQRKLQIVVVDDNEDAADLLAASLRNHGHTVRVALDPVEALETIRAQVPDVALLDLGLPVMDGYELAEQLRTELGARCPTLIAITGYGQEKDRQRSSQAGFSLHLVKPVQLSTVLEALQLSVPPPEPSDDREQRAAE